MGRIRATLGDQSTEDPVNLAGASPLGPPRSARQLVCEPELVWGVIGLLPGGPWGEE